MKSAFPLLKAAAAVVIWGVAFIAAKVALREIAPMMMTWLRFAIGLGVIGVYLGVRGGFRSISRREAGHVALLGFIGIALHQWLQANGLVTAEATTSAWIMATIPIFIAGFGRILLKERLTPLIAAGILIAAAGVLLIVAHGNLRSLASGSFGRPGDLLVFLSAPNWALFSVLSRKSLRSRPATQTMFFVMLFGWLFVLVPAAAEVRFSAQIFFSSILSLSFPALLAILFLGIFSSGFAYIFWYDALQAVAASRVGSFLYIEPVIASAAAFLILGERFTPLALLGALLILLGVLFVNRV